MNKSIKNSYILDIVYGCCFILVFLAILLFTTNSDGDSLLIEHSYKKLFTKCLWAGYLGLIYGVYALIATAGKMRNIDATLAKIDLEKRRSVNKFVRGATMRILAWVIFVVFMFFMFDEGKGDFRKYVSYALVVIALILCFVSRGIRKKYIKNKKADAATAVAAASANTAPEVIAEPDVVAEPEVVAEPAVAVEDVAVEAETVEVVADAENSKDADATPINE